MPRQVVRPSYCASVTLRYDSHMGPNTLKIISWLISLVSSLSADSKNVSLPQRKQHEIVAGIRVQSAKLYNIIAIYNGIARFACDRTTSLL